MRSSWRLAAMCAAGAGAAAVAVLLTATAAAAFVSTGCTASASDSTGKAVPVKIVIDGTNTWNVSKSSKLSGEGRADTVQTRGAAYATAFGLPIPIPIASGTGRGQTGSGSLDVSAVSGYVRVIEVSGSSDSCTGYLVLVVQDESVLDTLAGKLAIAAIAIGGIGLLLVGLRSRAG